MNVVRHDDEGVHVHSYVVLIETVVEDQCTCLLRQENGAP